MPSDNKKKYNVYKDTIEKDDNIVNFTQQNVKFFESDSLLEDICDDESLVNDSLLSTDLKDNTTTIVLSSTSETNSINEKDTQPTKFSIEFEISMSNNQISLPNKQPDKLLKTKTTEKDNSLIKKEKCENPVERDKQPIKLFRIKSNVNDSKEIKCNDKIIQTDQQPLNPCKIESNYKEGQYTKKEECYKTLKESVIINLRNLEIPVEIKGYEMNGEDISRLIDSRWLNDKIINSYMEYLHDYDTKLYVFSSYFYSKLNIVGVKKVIKYTENINIFKFSLLYWPVHLHNHWVFVCYDVKNNKLEYRDSLLGYDKVVMDNLSEYLKYEYNRLYNKSITINKVCIDNIRGQYNGYDCGVFVLVYAKQRLRNLNDIVHKNMMRYRIIILYELFIKRKIVYYQYD